MRERARAYYHSLTSLLNSVSVRNEKAEELDFYLAIEKACRLIIAQSGSGHKMMFIGNGASAAISSHMATDFWKNAGIKAIAFNDISGLTCISNDFGYTHVFEKPIEMFGEAGDILIAVSSSGQSENILRATKAAKAKEVRVITLSGFDKNNPLRSLGEINFYVSSSCYGHVEVLHHSICHCMVDTIMANTRG